MEELTQCAQTRVCSHSQSDFPRRVARNRMCLYCVREVARKRVMDLAAAVQHLKAAKRVMILSGAGMSTAAGIPDFRSPGGLYGTGAQLLEVFTYLDHVGRPVEWQKEQLAHDIRAALTHSYFEVNPLPYHELRRGLIIGLGEGQWKGTLAHVLPEVLNRNGKLHLLASQNIDGLDHKVVSDKSKLYNPHGLMSCLVSEPMDVPLCTSPEDPLYQKYVSLVKTNIRDIYADRPARKGKSSHLWPGPATSTPITLDMFGDLLPTSGPVAAAAERERVLGTYSVKPGTVLFDRTLWTRNAAGERVDFLGETAACDLLLVMGTSLSGLTIDIIAHAAGQLGKPRIVFDMTDAPVRSMQQQSSWSAGRDVHLQSPLDVSVLEILSAMGWLQQLVDFLPHICLRSLLALQQFVRAKGTEADGSALNEAVEAAIDIERKREKHFYGDEPADEPAQL